MDTRKQREYVDWGFGFPVYLRNVTMVKVRGTWVPKVNHNQLAEAVLLALVHKPARWTGDELRFVRLQLKLSLAAFAERFYVTHPAVIKWESRKDAPTRMKWATEKDIRLHVHLQTADELVPLYKQLRKAPSERRRRTQIDAAETFAYA